MTANPQIHLTDLPDGSQTQMDFLDSSWFRDHGQTRPFPSPEQVRSLQPPLKSLQPVVFEQLNLIVKFGVDIKTSEAINLWAVRKAFQGLVPVPEVYGWRVDKRDGKLPQVFIYMQLIHGPTLEQRWDSMLFNDKEMVCSDLQTIVSRFRKLSQARSEQVICSVTYGPNTDRCLESLPLLRPFSTPNVFHDWLSWLWRRHVPDPQSIEDSWRNLLPDNTPVVFTHGDLRPANIIVTATSPVRVVAIVDWEQAGWYPDYWEYCKANFTAAYDGEWRGWIDSFLEPHRSALEAFDFYTCTLGAF